MTAPHPDDEWEDGDGDNFLPDGFQDHEQPWRGMEHPAPWPEQDAGPEYWLLRGMLDDEDDEDNGV